MFSFLEAAFVLSDLHGQVSFNPFELKSVLSHFEHRLLRAVEDPLHRLTALETGLAHRKVLDRAALTEHMPAQVQLHRTFIV